ncbi:ferrous iron transport protein B [Flavobacteriaceae bacterium]|nr:ferrous iron transport protein B [Flavobacteriaceae bacterium]
MSKQIKVALIGNPNTGKTSVFNALTGLNQKVGNYPGITVDKKEGVCKLSRGVKAHILDLPGTYSLNASSLDENVVIELLLNKKDKDYPDVALIISDVENLKRNLLLFTQIKDLKIPAILVINMADRMPKKGISLNLEILEHELKTKVALVSTRKNDGIQFLKKLIENFKTLSTEPCLDTSTIDEEYFANLKKAFPNQDLYKLWVVISQDANFGKIDRNSINVSRFKTKTKSELKRLQQKETIKRYQFINEILKVGQTVDKSKATDLRSKLDNILTHKIWGYVIFFWILLTIFQVIYDWATIPMDLIDSSFALLADWVKTTFPGGGKLTNLVAEGIISGIGGIVIFIPQIAFLFLFISVLEESGYMSRVVFLMDKVMRRFGLSGKSVVPLISGTACAIPAIMATRNIENWKERLITILVTPFTTCSARLPVYLIIIALVIPEGRFLGLSYQALTLMMLYLIGFGMAVLSAYILNKILKTNYKTFFVIEMPSYKIPLLKNVVLTVLEKTKTFILEAGKIILAISVVLWILASYGPSKNFNDAEVIIQKSFPALTGEVLDNKIAAYKLEHSFIGRLGKTIEPAIRPLGYDWKIGIGVITSFAAREVFVGTLATIYSVGSSSEDNDKTIKNRMAQEVHDNGDKVFTLASGISLLLFYAFAMQCMSTLAIVKRETNSWKWPIIQLLAMSLIAYVIALIAFQILK